MVTMPGDRLWMPTLLMFRSFSSACKTTAPAQPAAHAAPGRLCTSDSGICTFLLSIYSAREDC